MCAHHSSKINQIQFKNMYMLDIKNLLHGSRKASFSE